MLQLTYFDLSDFDCKETGNNEMDHTFLKELDELRRQCGFPFNISSGYRDPSHSEERDKAKPGAHSDGIAADIKVANGAQRYIIAQKAIGMGFSGIGVSKSFVHVDMRPTTQVLWTY